MGTRAPRAAENATAVRQDRCDRVIGVSCCGAIWLSSGLETMATGNRSPFNPFVSHRSALASCLALALLLPAAALAAPPPAPVPSPGFAITTFAGPLAGSTAPDSIAVVGSSVWVAYGNGGNPDGSGGAKSQ